MWLFFWYRSVFHFYVGMFFVFEHIYWGFIVSVMASVSTRVGSARLHVLTYIALNRPNHIAPRLKTTKTKTTTTTTTTNKNKVYLDHQTDCWGFWRWNCRWIRHHQQRPNWKPQAYQDWKRRISLQVKSSHLPLYVYYAVRRHGMCLSLEQQ